MLLKISVKLNWHLVVDAILIKLTFFSGTFQWVATNTRKGLDLQNFGENCVENSGGRGTFSFLNKQGNLKNEDILDEVERWQERD